MRSIDGRQRDRNIRSLTSDSNETMANAVVGESIMPCTIKDIARLAEVSTATVSRVVNGAQNVSCEIRTKVLSAISKLQYCPNANAIRLAQANRGISRKHKSRSPTLVGTGTRLHSGQGINEKSKDRRGERLRLLERENSLLRRLVSNLSMELDDVENSEKAVKPPTRLSLR